MIDPATRDKLINGFRHGVLVGLYDTSSHSSHPGERKARLLLEVLRDRSGDVLRFAHDLRVPPPPTRQNATCGPARPSRTCPGG